MKATEQYFPVVLFIMLYKRVHSFESVNEILRCGYLSENYLAVLLKSQLCKATIVEIFLPVSIFTALGAKSAHFLTWSQTKIFCLRGQCI